MSIHRHQSTWRGITFNARYADAGANPDSPANIVSEALVLSDYYLDSCDISRVSVQDYRELRQFLEGADRNEAYEGVRAINGVGRIVGNSYADTEDKAWALNSAFSVASTRIAAAAADPVGVLPFSFKRDTAPSSGVDGVAATKALRFYCAPGPGRPVAIPRKGGGIILPFSFQLIAFDPFAYDETETQTLITGGATVTNPGNIYTRLGRIRITFSGVGNAALTITNTTTGNALVINASTSAAAEVWIVDLWKGTMYRLSDGANRYSQRVSGFISSMHLNAGANVFTVANTANVSAIRYEFRGAYA